MSIDHQALLHELLPLLDSPRRSGKEIMSFCPAHADGHKHQRRGGRSLELNAETGLLHCLAGCGFTAILEAFGLSPNGQREPSLPRTPPGAAPGPGPVIPSPPARDPFGTLVAVYEYRDEVGHLCGEKGRFELPDGSKSFRWRQPGAQGWPGGIVVAEMPLWGAELVAAADPDTEIVYAEGEKAALACRAQGLLAVTNGGGAGTTEFGDALQVLRGRHVLLWPDNDPAGRAYMRRVEMALRPIARSVRYAVPSMALPVHGDAVDYFAAGGTWADMEAGLLREAVAEALADDAIRVRVPTPAGTVTLTFSSIEVSRRAVDCELAVLPPGVAEMPYEERINLLSSSQRESLRRALDTIYGKDVGWTRVLATAWPMVRTTLAQMSWEIDTFDVNDVTGKQFLVDTLMPMQEPTVLFGDGSSGKTYLAVMVAVSCALGRPFLDLPTRQATTLYVDYETTSETLRWRVGRVMRGLGLYGVLPNMIWYWQGRGTALSEQVLALRAAVAKRGVGLVIIDSAGAACGGEPEKAEVALRYFNSLAQLGVTTLTIAHVSKTTDMKTPFGSVFWQNAARRTWYVERAQEEGSDRLELGLFCRKVNDGPMPPPFGITVEFDGMSGPVTFGGADIRDTPELQARRGVKAQIIDALRAGGQTPAVLATMTSLDAATISRTLRRHEATFVRLGVTVRGQETTWGLRQRL